MLKARSTDGGSAASNRRREVRSARANGRVGPNFCLKQSDENRPPLLRCDCRAASMRPDSPALKYSRRSGIEDSLENTTRLAAVRWAEGDRGCGTSFYERVEKMSTGRRLSLEPLLPCCCTRPEGHIRHGPRKFPPQSDASFPSASRNPRSPTGSDSQASSQGLSTVPDRRRTRRVRRAARREHGRPCAVNRRDSTRPGA